jgi:hypothetical protein
MTYMSPEQIQVIALFLSYLLRKTSKRVHISERLDLIQQKPSYTPADEIASPEIPHFARIETVAQDGATEHTDPSRPTMQAPVLCQLCGAGFLSPQDVWAHVTKEHQRQERDSSSKSSSELVYHYIQQTSAAWPATSCTTCCTLTQAATQYDRANAP